MVLWISNTSLLSNDTGDAPLGIQSVGASTNGATISEDATTIYYSNPNNVADQFSYTATNAWGTSVGTVTVKVLIANAGADHRRPSGGTGSGYTYAWLSATGLNDPTLANPTATPSTTTTYTVWVTNAG